MLYLKSGQKSKERSGKGGTFKGEETADYQ